jgi:hypothetical protein
MIVGRSAVLLDALDYFSPKIMTGHAQLNLTSDDTRSRGTIFVQLSKQGFDLCHLGVYLRLHKVHVRLDGYANKVWAVRDQQPKEER